MGLITNYIIRFRNAQLIDVEVKITDYKLYDSTGDNTVAEVPLIGIAPAFELESFNTAEDKFNPIIAQRATIRFKSTNEVSFSTFASGEDYRFFVRATYNAGANFIFSGWLVMDDNYMAYLPPGQPVVLSAIDNLGVLKNIELSDFDEARPQGKHKLIKIIAWCLKKTNGNFLSYTDRIKVASNLFESNHHSFVNNCPLNQTYVDVLTFEKSIGKFEDCFTVLQKILFSLGARGCYYENDFYILRIDEYKNSAFVLHTYDTGGSYISRTLGFTLDKNIGTDIPFIQAETIQRIQRPFKSAICEIDHDFPKELPCNKSFKRGTARPDVDDTLTEYDIECWTQYKGPPNVTNDGDAFIRVLNSPSNLETERFVVFPVQPTDDQYYIESEPIYVCPKDKFSLNVDIRHDGQVETAATTGNYNVMQVRLYADDGTYYILDPVDDLTPLASWVVSNASWSINRYFKRFYDGTEDDTEWHNIGDTFENLPAIPKTGYITICLHQTKKSDQFETHFANLSFEYVPLVDGSYKITSGEQFKMSTLLYYTKEFNEKYFLFDAPCKSFKGAMFYEDSGDYFLTANWIDFAMETYAIPDLLNYAYSFLHWQCNAAWNQTRLETWLLQSYLYGFDFANGHPGLIHKYSILNAISPVNRMNFIALSMRQNWHDCTWRVTFAGINDTANVRQGGNSNGENFEFKYLE